MADPDLNLALSARAGDADAFGQLVERHQPMLAAILHRFAKSNADLEDMVQDSFIKTWNALPDWEPRQPFVHWLKRIAVRTGLEYCRKQKRSPIEYLEILPESSAPEDQDPANAALEEARVLLAKLPADDQALLTLIHLHGMSMEEAASHFGWSRAKAKVKAFRARKSLQKTLSQLGYRYE